MPTRITERLEASARESFARVDALAEVGRVFSGKNAQALRAARDTLAALLSQIDDDDADDTGGPSESTVRRAIKKANRAVDEVADEALSHDDTRRQLHAALNAGRVGETPTAWVRDVFDERVIYDLDGVTFQQAYTAENDDVELSGDPVEVRTEWVPVGGGTSEAHAPLPDDGRIPVRESVKVQALERAVADDGTTLVKVIDPGWGSSGYYSAEVLKKSGPVAFPAGTHMYWDHATEDEREQRPERSLRDLAAVLTEHADWIDDGPQGPGLYAPANVKPAYRAAVEDLAADIGVSIQSWAVGTEGEADGEYGRIIEDLLPAETNSVDFVTLPGRGGAVIQAFEARRAPSISRKEAQRGTMPAELTLEQAVARITELEGELSTSEANASRYRDTVAGYIARDIATEAVVETDLPDAAKRRIVETVKPVMHDEKIVDRDAVVEAVAKAVTAEEQYLASVTGAGRVTGMGGGSAPSTEAYGDVTEAAFLRIGMTESGAKIAAKGRS